MHPSTRGLFINWQFVRDGRKIEIRVHSQLGVNNAAAFIAEDLARSSIASGKLARIL